MIEENIKHLPNDFRKLPVHKRRVILSELYQIPEEEFDYSGPFHGLLDLADVMVESASGVLPVPLGIASSMLIDGQERNIPMATEEPSVIAAATYGGKMLSHGGGIRTDIDDPIMTAQIFLEDPSPDAVGALCEGANDPDAPATATAALQELDHLLSDVCEELIPGMTKRGGGYRGCDAVYLPASELLRIQIHIDVRDAMGANILNTAAEHIKPVLAQRYGGRGFMAILTNDSPQRLARASFCLPLRALRRRGIQSRTLAERIVRASRLAQEDPSRAVTHNKGIMNGITALALATGNDTRGLEAAVHRFAARSGSYRGLSRYYMDEDNLYGEIEIPVPLGSVGGAIGFHPVTRTAFRILQKESAEDLGRVAAALGLAQNFAALSALISEGIQHGHMRFHAHRLAYQAGARGEEIAAAAQGITDAGVFNLQTAEFQLAIYRKKNDTCTNRTESGPGEILGKG
ncbi:hydroxymethylglutaryl-CoA reductase, degradative [Spirochaeta dissipatitropha]